MSDLKKGLRYNKLSRRLFIQGSLGATLALPPLLSLMPKDLFAADEDIYGPFFVGIQQFGPWYISKGYGAHGIKHSLRDRMQNEVYQERIDNAGYDVFVNPLASPGNSQLVNFEGAKHRMGSLTSMVKDGKLCEYIDEKYNSFLEKMVCMNGFAFNHYHGHHHGASIGNWAATFNGDGFSQNLVSTPTIDQIMAYTNTMYGNDFFGERVIALHTQNHGFYSRSNGWNYVNPATKSGGVVGSHYYSSTKQIWDKLNLGYFNTGKANSIAGTSGSGNDQTVVDLLLKRVNRVLASNKISGEDKKTLQNHLDFVHESSQKMNKTFSCGTDGVNLTFNTESNQTLKEYNTLLVLAMSCGITKIGRNYVTHMPWPIYGVQQDTSLQVRDKSGSLIVAGGWHELSHALADAEGETSEQNKMNVWNNYKNIIKNCLDHSVLDLMKKMDEVKFSDQESMLDKALIAYFPEASTNHNQADISVVLAGGANGRLNTNKFIDFADRDTPFGEEFAAYQRDFSRLLTTIMHLLNIPYDEYKVPRPGGGFYKGIGDDQHFDTSRVSRYGLAQNDMANLDIPLDLLLKK